jgi:hypothetical protein
MSYSYSWALSRFQEVLSAVKHNVATDVYEARSLNLNSIKNQKKMLESVPHGSAIWQHTETYHIAMIYIERGKGQRFNRTLLDLIASGVDTDAKFKRAWLAKNKGNMGTFPTVKSSRTSQVRQSQASYILARQSVPANPNSRIPGNLNVTHRTHLISAQTTGIESHKGLLIDFDGWLNSKPMNDYETEMLQVTTKQDVIWTAFVARDRKGFLHFRYIMYNKHWQVISSQEWIDDRWTYEWRVD